jgi:hypothetical protein
MYEKTYEYVVWNYIFIGLYRFFSINQIFDLCFGYYKFSLHT